MYVSQCLYTDVTPSCQIYSKGSEIVIYRHSVIAVQQTYVTKRLGIAMQRVTVRVKGLLDTHMSCYMYSHDQFVRQTFLVARRAGRNCDRMHAACRVNPCPPRAYCSGNANSGPICSCYRGYHGRCDSH